MLLWYVFLPVICCLDSVQSCTTRTLETYSLSLANRQRKLSWWRNDPLLASTYPSVHFQLLYWGLGCSCNTTQAGMLRLPYPDAPPPDCLGGIPRRSQSTWETSTSAPVVQGTNSPDLIKCLLQIHKTFSCMNSHYLLAPDGGCRAGPVIRDRDKTTLLRLNLRFSFQKSFQLCWDWVRLLFTTMEIWKQPNSLFKSIGPHSNP